MADRLTAMEIEGQDFKRRLRGFDEEEVRLYLRSVSEEVERLNLQNAEQREAIGELRTKLEDFAARERALQDALIAAQRLSEDLLQKARSEADLLIQQARAKSERMLQQAQDQLARIEDEIGHARVERESFERQLRSVLEHHLELLDLRQLDRNLDEPGNLTLLRHADGSEAG